jgi:predicted RNA-binding protein associated with RNAse of E/G family
LERRKHLGRVNKEYYNSVTSKIIRIHEVDLAGYVAYLQVNKVNRPFMVGDMGAEICLANNGYFEITFLPDDENWQMSAMYDNHGDIIEWYVDITRKNTIDEEGNPYCDDLYLDAALMPDGSILIFDEDELQNALIHGNINQSEFDMAYRVLNKLIDSKIIDLTYMKALCSRLLSLFE